MYMSGEVVASQSRFQRTMGISLLAHALLFAWLLLHESIASIDEGIVEITWLEPAPPAPAPPPFVAKKPVPRKPEPTVAAQPVPEKKFLRREVASEVEPTPQLRTANRDLVRQRLDALRPASEVDGVLTPTPPSSRALLAAASPEPAPVPKGNGAELKREDTMTSPPQTLRRSALPTPRRATAAAQVAVDAPIAATGVPDLDNAARRSLAGAELMGEIADRPVQFHVMPEYPEWAKDQAVEGTVTLRFTVLADGRVKENIQVERTAGFAEFDDNAVAALRRWRFAPLEGQPVEQRGAITFRYRLRD